MRRVTVWILVFAMCVSSFADKSNGNATESGPRIFLISPRLLFYAKGTTTDERIGVATSKKIRPLNVAYHAGRGVLYFTSQRSGFWTKNAKLYSLPWDYDFSCDGATVKGPFCLLTEKEIFYSRTNEMTLLREEENWNPRSLAVDYIADKLYIVNTGERSVNVFDLDGNNKYTVFENETLIPLEVALDPPLGSMFILAVNTQNGTNQVYRANMDGTNRQLIVEEIENAGDFAVQRKVGFTLDTVNKNIYFGNFNKGVIEKVDYEGNSRITVTNATNPISVGIYNDTLYWSDSDAEAKFMFLCLRVKCALYTCKLSTNGNCTESSIQPYQEVSDSILKFHALKVVDRNSQLRITENPCSENNGNCQHHCLLRSSPPGYSCACKNGWRLADDQKNCTEEEEKSVYVDALVSHVAKFSELYNSSDSRIVLMPRHLLAHLMRAKSRMLFHAMPFRYLSVNARGSALTEQELAPVDSMTGDTSTDFALNLFGFSLDQREESAEEDYDFVMLHRVNGYISPSLAYDWISRNLYFVKLQERGRQTGELSVLKYDKPNNVSFGDYRPEEPVMTLRTVDAPVSLAVDPYRGYLFSVTSYGNIVRYDLNGSNEVVFSDVNNAKVVAVDLNDDYLYWLSDDGYVGRTNLNGTQPTVKVLRNRVVAAAEAFVVFDRWLFLKSNERIWRVDKTTGMAAGNLGQNYKNLFHESVGLKVSARDAKLRPTVKSPCTALNGGCQQYCFPVPRNGTESLGRICGCGSGYRLLEDALGCEKLEEEGEDNTAARTEDYEDVDWVNKLYMNYYYEQLADRLKRKIIKRFG